MLFFFYPFHFTGSTFVPFDSQVQVYPFAVFISSRYRSGEIPLWNPYIYSGTPSFADPLYMTFYPGTLLFLLPEVLSQHFFNMVELLHIFIGGLSLFLFLNYYKLNKWASLSASIVFMLGGPLTGRLQHFTQISAVSLFPAILLSTLLGIRKQKLFWFGLSGFILGWTLMIGYQPAMLFCIVLFAYFMIEFFQQHQLKKSSIKPLIVQFGFLVLIALGCALIQVLPSIQFAQLSSRSTFTYDAATAGSVPPSTLFTFIFPNIFNTIKGEYWGPIDITEGYLFNGMIPFFFILFSIFSWKKTKSVHKFFLVVLIISLFYSLGRHTPLYYILYKVFPPVRLFKRPSDALFIFQLAIAISIGFGLELFIRNLYHSFRDTFTKFISLIVVYLFLIFIGQFFININNPQTKFLTWYFLPNLIPLILIILAFSFRNNLNKQVLYISLALCIFTDITFSSSNRYINSTPYAKISINEGTVYGCSEIVEFLENNVGELYRYEAINAGGMWQNSAAIWRIPSSHGYSPLIINTYNEFAKPKNTRGDRDFSGFIDSYNSPLFDLLGVKYIVTAEKTLDYIDPNIDTTDFELITTKCGNIFENNDPIPLLYFVNNIFIKEDEIHEYFSDELLYDPREVVFLEKLPAVLKNKYPENNTSMINLNQGHDKSGGTIDILNRTNNKLIVRTYNGNDSILIYNDSFYPGWHVYIDGEEEELLLTNYTFKGVLVPKGIHRVEFIFEPLIFKLGLLFHISSLISLFLCILIEIKKRHQLKRL